jgi:flavorubredoxin
MDTTVTEIADGIYRLSTWIPDIGPPAGFTMNQFLIDAEEPLLFHCGGRGIFDSVSAAAAKVMPLERVRWITFGHVESDECGSMNQWLAAAPHSEVAHGGLGCMVSLNDLADRPPRPLEDNELIDLGGKRVRHLDTPHLPHGWEARVIFEETTGTLFCGDLFGQFGNDATVEDTDLVSPALDAEAIFRSTCLTPDTAPQLRRLAALEPTRLALMHGPTWSGDAVGALNALADGYERMFAEACKPERGV